MAKINLTITKAKKEQICVKVLVSGPSGSGKSYSALRLATGIAGRVGEGTKIGYIGTEGMRDKLYANEFDYDLISLEEYSPDYYIAANPHIIKKRVSEPQKKSRAIPGTLLNHFTHDGILLISRKTRERLHHPDDFLRTLGG